MKKAGLQKKIAFIFDGQESSEQTPSRAGNSGTQPMAAPTACLNPSAPLYKKNDSPADKSGAVPTEYPVSAQRPTVRPQPVHRNNTAGVNTITLRKAMGILKNRLAGSSGGKTSKHQQKMGLLVAVLMFVLVAVLYYVLGSGPSIASALTQDTPSEQNTSPASSNKKAESWKIPDSFPEPVRDPMKSPARVTSAGTVIQGSLSVRGIVYSTNKPSAIISGQVLFEGESIGDIRVCKIQKDSVEFEKNGKRWTQQVEQQITEQ